MDNHKPDFVWIKNRNSCQVIILCLTQRFCGATNILYSNLTNAENTIASSLSAFNTNGFTVVSDNGSADVNGNGRTYVAWSWRAGGNKNTFNVDDVGYASAAAAGLDGGTITPTGASVGTRQGFSIIKYTGNQASDGATVFAWIGKNPPFHYS